MALSHVEHAAENEVRCPTCRARQEWSDTCRRCQCDLSLLWTVELACRRRRRRALLALRAGRHADALAEARRAYTLHPDAPTARLLAVCLLLAGRWPEALATAERIARES
jgi:hypothetical protein